MLINPEIADRSCDDCERFLYTKDGLETFANGTPKPRPKNVPTPCASCPKIPVHVLNGRRVKVSRADAIELNEVNREAWEHYQRCRATGRFPDDPIVARDASVIRKVERVADENTIARLLGRFVREGGL